MKKKPISILIASFVYLLIPLFYYFQISYVSSTNFWNILGVFSNYDILAIFLSLSAIVGSYCVFIVKRWAWYVFIANSIIAIILSGRVVLFFPQFFVISILFIAVNIMIVLCFILIKDMRMPYFNPRIRWWEQEKRYRFDLPAMVHFLQSNIKVGGQIFDISASGIFWCGDINKGAMGQNVSIKIIHELLSIFQLVGEVVWVSDGTGRQPKGCGVKFNINKTEQKKLRKTIKDISDQESR